MSRECAMQEATGTGRWSWHQPYVDRSPINGGSFEAHAATLPDQLRETLECAVAEAAEHTWDVHTWKHGVFVGIEFRPSTTPHVRVWEWPVHSVIRPGEQATT